MEKRKRRRKINKPNKKTDKPIIIDMKHSMEFMNKKKKTKNG